MTDLEIARKYLNQASRATDRGITFTMSFGEFKRLMLRKRCAYSELPFSEPDPDGKIRKQSLQRTLDRINPTKGYEDGNVVAVCSHFNNLKSLWEQDTSPIAFKDVKRAVKNIEKRMAKS